MALVGVVDGVVEDVGCVDAHVAVLGQPVVDGVRVHVHGPHPLC